TPRPPSNVRVAPQLPPFRFNLGNRLARWHGPLMKLVTIEWGSVKFIVPHKLSSDYCSFRQERKFKVQSGFENIGIVRRTRASDTLDQRPKANGILVAFGKEVRSH